MALDISKLEQELQERGRITTLDNGAVIISENNHNTGLVQGSVIITAGSFHEDSQYLGIMHFLEHMVFEG